MRLFVYEAKCNAPYPIGVTGRIEASNYERAARAATHALMLEFRMRNRARHIDGAVCIRTERLEHVHKE